MKDIAVPAYEALNRLADHGHKAYIVGGALRDILLKRPISDYDITTSAKPKAIEEAFKDCKTFNIGQKHGSIAVLIDGYQIEITPFRRESEYKDHRHPDKVEFVEKLEDDLARRDLTVNALCLDKDDNIIDLFNGIDDLNNKLLRAIGDPDVRFREDALRILRTIRFKVQLGFSIEESTKASLFRQKDLLVHISMERKKEELFKLLSNSDVKDTINEFLDIFRVFVPINKADDKVNSLSDPYFKFAYLIEDGFDLKTLKLSNQEISLINELKNALSIDVNDNYQFIKALASSRQQDTLLKFISELSNRDLSNRFKELKDYLANVANLAISGHELLSLGFKGKQISEIQNLIIDEIHRQKLANEPSAIKKFLEEKCYTR